jgi:hypothetical protein
MPRRFPPPWTVEQIPGGFKVKDANGQSLAYVYGRETKADADIAKVLTMDEARRIASNIAKLPRQDSLSQFVQHFFASTSWELKSVTPFRKGRQ